MAIAIIVLDATGKLTHLKPIIRTVSNTSIKAITKKLQIENLDIVFYESRSGTIPHLGIGGYTLTNTIINISIDPTFPDITNSLKNNLPNTLAHEMHHAKRNFSGETLGTLLDAIINEGLADHFSLELFGGKPYAWDKALTKNQVTQLMAISRSEWKSKAYDHNAWFFGSEKRNIPRWTGYSIGFYLVDKYLKKTGKKPSELTSAKSTRFI